MNFSEFSEAYEKSKEKAKKIKTKKVRRDDNPGDKNIVGDVHPYNVIGATGLNGDAPAFEEDIIPGPTPVSEESVEESIMYHPSEKDKRRDADRERANKAQDDRMRYGKKGKKYMDDTALRPGEVKRWDKENQKWVSNKD